jgi:hypothetical protein
MQCVVADCQQTNGSERLNLACNEGVLDKGKVAADLRGPSGRTQFLQMADAALIEN